MAVEVESGEIFEYIVSKEGRKPGIHKKKPKPQKPCQECLPSGEFNSFTT